MLSLDEAIAASAEVLGRQRWASAHPHAPAYSGGVLDAWPARDVMAFAHVSTELEVIGMVRELERRKKSGAGR